MHAFDTHAPGIKCVQDYENTCALISLDSTFFSANEYVAEHDVVSQLSSSLSCDNVGFMNEIKFYIDIVSDSVINKG